MPWPKVIPALADLTQDIAGPLPVELLREWVTGHQDLAKAAALLGSFEVSGTVVATDTSGLTRMTEERDLLDVLALVSQPKEIVHALGTAVGGRAIGTWVADNTEMHYPPDTPVESVVEAMSEAQARIERDAQVKIGMCVHAGDFYEIGGGLYGRDADAVEYLAERFAAPGEILLTHEAAARLDGGIARERRRELDVVHPPGVFTLASKPRLPGASTVEGTAYPHPYPEEFFRSLIALRSAASPAALRAEIYGSLLQERVIVFMARERELLEAANLATLLDSLAANALMEAVVNQSAAARTHVASLGGGLAILSFEEAQQAVDLSLAMRDAFVESGLPVKIGIDAGPVLLLAKTRGASGISGDAVNIASKISEDVGVVNMVSVTARVAQRVRGLAGAEPFTAKVSRVNVTGVRA